ncbi:MAG: M48 family metallopeptidase [Phycisphaeraceae bacterium]
MQLFALALIFGIFAHDAYVTDPLLPPEAGWRIGALVLGPKVAVALAYAVLCHATRRRLGKPGGAFTLRWLDRFTAVFRWAALLLYAHDLNVGALWYVRDNVADLVLLDELLIIAPTLALIGWGWWAYYPVDRRLREASLIRRLDAALPIHPIWTRWQFLLTQFRHQVALILLPLLILMAWVELIPANMAPIFGINPQPLLLIAGAACVLLFTPVMIRHLWHTEPLPPGQVRDCLTAMCTTHRVGVRELLLWHTFGGMLNAAVMGFVAPLRYILLTDALLEMLRPKQVEAVMAHEVAHVRRHHLFWLLAVAMVLLTVFSLIWDNALVLAIRLMPHNHTGGSASVAWITESDHIQVAASVAAVVSWVFAFGWVSRRFERQADTFAVQHLSRKNITANGDNGDRPHHEMPHIDADAVATMSAALQDVAELNHASPTRRSWRHGSIVWRQNYLRSLIGRPIGDLPIDRQIFRIKFIAAITLIALITVMVLNRMNR